MPSRKNVQLLVVPFVLATGASCFLVTDSCACSEPAPEVGFRGVVRDSLGSALEGISVSLAIGVPTCGELTPASHAVTDTTGAYRVGAVGPAEGTAACAELEALRFLATSVDTVRRGDIAVTFEYGEPMTLDLVFPPR